MIDFVIPEHEKTHKARLLKALYAFHFLIKSYKKTNLYQCNHDGIHLIFLHPLNLDQPQAKHLHRPACR